MVTVVLSYYSKVFTHLRHLTDYTWSVFPRFSTAGIAYPTFEGRKRVTRRAAAELVVFFSLWVRSSLTDMWETSFPRFDFIDSAHTYLKQNVRRFQPLFGKTFARNSAKTTYLHSRPFIYVHCYELLKLDNIFLGTLSFFDGCNISLFFCSYFSLVTTN